MFMPSSFATQASESYKLQIRIFLCQFLGWMKQVFVTYRVKNTEFLNFISMNYFKATKTAKIAFSTSNQSSQTIMFFYFHTYVRSVNLPQRNLHRIMFYIFDKPFGCWENLGLLEGSLRSNFLFQSINIATKAYHMKYQDGMFSIFSIIKLLRMMASQWPADCSPA